MRHTRVLLADDHVLILEGFRKVLEPHCEIVGAVTDGKSLVDAALSLKPDLIMLDLIMPALNGIEAARQIRKQLPEVKLLFVSMHASPTYLREAITAGAQGYLLKSSAREEILGAVQKVLSGEDYITKGIVAEDFDVSSYRTGKRIAGAKNLTPREREILKMIAEGKSGKEMASVLNISTKTVAFHREHVKIKLGLRTIAELTKYAIHEGFA
jgi:DNA-binding NarL/FixJ family response regulator